MARSLSTVLVVLWCLLVGLPLAVTLTPDVELTVAGQHLSIGARQPSLSLSGPAQVVQIGNTALDVPALRVYGPLRPRLSIGPVDRDAAASALSPETGAKTRSAAATTIGIGFVRWYASATVILIGLTAAAIGVAGCAAMVRTVRRLSRTEPGAVAHVWRHTAGRLRGMATAALTVTLTAWAAAGVLAYDGAAHGLRQVKSLSDLVGTHRFSPSPVGPKVHGYAGVVIGDSRAARFGGPTAPDASADDRACARSTDSLAAEVGQLTGAPAVNLACTGASIAAGLLGAQTLGDRVLPPQVGLLKQVEGVRYVVVVIGPNDLYWTDFLRYCYGVDSCEDNLTQGEFGYRLAAFDRDYGDLLRDLADLPTRPRVVVSASYDVFAPDADCPDTRGPAGASGLSSDELRMLIDMNRRFNEVLRAGADKYGFAVAEPRLTPLCATGSPLGPDLQHLSDPAPFHPTAVGIVRMASAVAQALAAN
ncbi:GDSL-type esterase/lipase family protein [Asanoa iriomotensis]|uniref:GDSL-type esterase/lipase family protein n=1 Tax=Asanoa iriomotensis TaxID=234613 RepID=UPI001EF2C4D2|nr:GDSL-type esterase/lipase family protein [Asanoa iriomotensis]